MLANLKGKVLLTWKKCKHDNGDFRYQLPLSKGHQQQ
jgi:hypothetical protein